MHIRNGGTEHVLHVIDDVAGLVDRERALVALQRVGLSHRLGHVANELSGGEQQRAAIARALVGRPAIVLADEPTGNLDTKTSDSIVELLEELNGEGSTIVVITHNLGVVARYADRVNVMYAGKIVETATAKALYADPRHPYTLGLLKSVPRLDQDKKAKLEPIEGVPPDLINVPIGCSFYPRCTFRVDKCFQEVPPLLPVDEKHFSACWEWQRVGREKPTEVSG